MTQAEFVEDLRHLSFGGLYRRMSLQIDVDPPQHPGSVLLLLRLPTWDRDTGAPTEVCVSEMVPPAAIMAINPRDGAVHLVHGICRSLVLHELDEAITYRGGRPFEPHTQDVA